MTIKLDDAEAFATRELKRTHLDGHDAPPWDVALSRLDVDIATFDETSPIYRAGHVGRWGIIGGRPRVFVWDGMPERDQALTAWHEYMHHVVVDEHLELECHVERFCTRFAAAMVAPADSMRRAWRQADRDLLRLAELRPAASSSVLLLRLADVELARVALYDRRGLRHGGEVPRGTAKLVDLARRHGFSENDNARAWKLLDDPSRVGVVLAA